MRRPKHSCLLSENDKNLTHKKKAFSLIIFQGTCKMPSWHLHRKFIEIWSKQSSSRSETDDGKNIFLTQKLLFFKTFICTRRMHFWQLRLRISDKKMKLSRSKEIKRNSYPQNDPMETYFAGLTTPAHSFWNYTEDFLINVWKKVQPKSLSPNFCNRHVECKFHNSAKSFLTKTEFFRLVYEYI